MEDTHAVEYEIARYVSRHAVEQLKERITRISDGVDDEVVSAQLDRAVYIAMDRPTRDIRVGPDTQGEQATLVHISNEDFADAGGAIEGETFAMIKENVKGTSQFRECIVTVLSPHMAEKLMPKDGSPSSAKMLEKKKSPASIPSSSSTWGKTPPLRVEEKTKLVLSIASSNLAEEDKEALITILIGG